MHTLKTLVAAFVGTFAALFAFEAIKDYRKPGPNDLAVDVRPVPENRHESSEQRRSIPRGSIEWTDKPETKRYFP